MLARIQSNKPENKNNAGKLFCTLVTRAWEQAGRRVPLRQKIKQNRGMDQQREREMGNIVVGLRRAADVCARAWRD